MSDPVFTLNFLFQNGASPPCPDAADVDDDGQIAINDAIASLNAMFLGSFTIPPPFPELGEDLTDDDLGTCLPR